MKKKSLLAFLTIFAACCPFNYLIGQSGPESLYDKLAHAQKDYQKALEGGDPAVIAETSYILGKRFIGVRNYPRAQQWLLKSFDLKKKGGLIFDMGRVYLRLGEIQVFLENFDEAKRYAELADRTFRRIGSIKGLIGTSRFTGDVFQHQWHKNPEDNYKLDSAMHYYRRSLQLAGSIKDTMETGYSYQSIATTFYEKKDYSNCLRYYCKALPIFEHFANTPNILDVTTKIAATWLDQNQPDSAKKWLDKALATHRTKNAQLGFQERFLLDMERYYEQKGDLKTALNYSRQALELTRLHEKNGKDEAAKSVNSTYENELNIVKLSDYKSRNSLMQQNLTTQRKLLFVLMVLFVLIISLCYLFYKLFIKYKKTSAINAILVKEQNHRTKNNLQSISDLLSLQLYRLSDPFAVEALEESLLRVQAVTLIHRSLYQTDDLVYIDLVKFIPDLIQMIHKTYHMEGIMIQYEIDKIGLHTDQATSLGLIINELTTNSCKYAYLGSPSPALEVSCNFRNDRLYFKFADNGPGFASDTAAKDGFGLDLIRILADRLKTVVAFSTNNGCEVTMSFSGNVKSNFIGSKEKLKV